MNVQSTLRHAYENNLQGQQNLGFGERAVSTGLGLAIAAGGLRKGASLPGAIMGLVGAALVARGMTGHCPIKERLEGGHRDRLDGPVEDRTGHGDETLRDHAYAPTSGMR